MEKLSNEEVLTRKLIKSAGLEKPSAAFSANVLKAIAAKKVVREYKPLISVNVWIALAGVLVISMIGLYLLTSAQTLTLEFGYLKGLEFPKLQLSRTMTYAIGFVALFFLQIPFLKGLLERQMRF